MRSWIKHPFRVTGRLFWLAAELLFGALRYGGSCAFRSRKSTARAAWLQRTSRRILRVLQIKTELVGNAPRNGLLVCNHLSYLDILVLAALTPSQFVAKSEVSRWPVFGWFARLAGTIFVDRRKPSLTGQSVNEITTALRHDVLVVLFPEGTSSGGETVLPFKSSLLEPATRYTCALTAGLIAYDLEDGDVSEEICYWKDMTLVPHLINLLSKRAIRGAVSFAQIRPGSTNRKELALQMHTAVLNLKKSFVSLIQV
jgi:1-acyl-sn-glycerol-3-phosphate acyltransferase